jgi:metallo-beta-lactamase family protein
LKATKEDGIYFIGNAAEDVTGSMYYIRFNGYQILLEAGLYQSASSNYLEAYRENTRKLEYDPKEIDFIFIGHAHIDHTGLIPRLYKEGCHARIIARKATAEIVDLLWHNSAYILGSESICLSKRFGREYPAIYNKADVENALSYIDIFDETDKLFTLAEGITFQWLTNGHCVGAGQLQLILKDRKRTKKILYTSDLGEKKRVNHFVDNTEIPNFFNDYTIMESTYGEPSRTPKFSRTTDLKRMEKLIRETLDKNAQVIMPAFSFVKSQELLVCLYHIFGKDENFHTDIIVDSMLTVDICKAYEKILQGDDLILWKEAMHWKNVHLIREKEDSLACIQNDHQKIVIASSGFCNNGRVLEHLRHNIKNKNAMIFLTGYAGDNNAYISYKLKNHQKTITLFGTSYPNRANCEVFESFSSHMSRKGLIEYGSHIRTNKLVLVHGSPEAKKALRPDLQEAISQQNKTHEVLVSHRGMFLPL